MTGLTYEPLYEESEVVSAFLDPTGPAYPMELDVMNRDFNKYMIHVSGFGQRSLMVSMITLRAWARELMACCHYSNYDKFPSVSADYGEKSIYSFCRLFIAVQSGLQCFLDDQGSD